MRYFNYNKRTMRVNRKLHKIEKFFGAAEALFDVSRQMWKIARRFFPKIFKARAKYNKWTLKNWR